MDMGRFQIISMNTQRSYAHFSHVPAVIESGLWSYYGKIFRYVDDVLEKIFSVKSAV